MDINTTQLNSLTKEKRDALMKARKCFKCFQLGHVSCNCPQRQRGQQTYHSQTSAHITKVVDDRDDLSEAGSTSTQTTRVNNTKLKPDMIIRALKGYMKEERDKFLDKILLKGEDFQNAQTQQPGQEQ
jgi:hypothetical protein